MAVVEGSPAAKAGLLADDQLVAVNGRALNIGPDAAAPPTRLFVEQAQQILFEEMKKGAVTLRVAGPAGLRDIGFTAEPGCPARVELIPGQDVNAWADGQRVVISAGLLERCRTDDDLALVIAHELAHNLLHHGQRLAAARKAEARLFLPSGSGSATMRDTEEEADRYGVGIATAAGYDLSQAETFVTGLMNGISDIAGTHPALDRRIALLKAAIAAAGTA
jgi:predicted Zn-dependent protease